MRIDDRSSVAGTATGRATEVEQARAVHAGRLRSRSQPGSDSVELSGTSLAVGSFALARESKIQQLSKAVQGGTYSVDSASISRALVGETLASGYDS